MEVQIANPHISEIEVDHYYHLGLSNANANDFGNVKVVLMGGSGERMEHLATRIYNEIPNLGPFTNEPLKPIGKTDRFKLYKIGPIICVSHGMGSPSMLILLHEITKLLNAAKATDVVYVRVGTSGGLGLKPGTVVLSTEAVNGLCQPIFTLYVLGQIINRPCYLDPALRLEILKSAGNIKVEMGKTMATNDFYEAQGRLDGAICEHGVNNKMDWLKSIHSQGIVNIEMESDCFAAFCAKLGIRGAVCCTVLVDRLLGDQVRVNQEELKQINELALTTIIQWLASKY